MGKLFRRKKKYSDEEFDDDMLEDDDERGGWEDDRFDDDEWEDKESEEDEEAGESDDELEDEESDEEESDGDKLEDERSDGDGAEDEEPESGELGNDEGFGNDELEGEWLGSDEAEGEELDGGVLESEESDGGESEDEESDGDEAEEEEPEDDEAEEEEPEEEESEDEDSDDDEEDDEEDDDDEEDEEDRRAYRRRRRIRNQIISYSVVAVILAAIVAGGVFVGRSIAAVVKEKQYAKEQEQLQAEQEAEAAHEVVIDAPPEVIEEEPEEDYLGKLVENSISGMPIEHKVAGLFIVTPEALTGVGTAIQAGDGTQEALNEYAVGGLIYFAKNILDKEQITGMLSNTIAMSRYPIFLAVDEEGGSVSRVAQSGIEVIQVGDMAAVGETGDTAQAYEAGLTIGTYLSELGFNLDFAPVADVAGLGDGAMGDRVFGSDPQLVGGMVANMVEGIEGTGVSACLKHFPGIGDASDDTHDGRVETSKTLDEMRGSDLMPFQVGIGAGADFVMVSHITAPAVDEAGVPSSMSRVLVTDVLRNELGFQGVVITDALDMGAVTDYYTSAEAAVMAIQAGADMLLMPEDFQAAYEALLAAVEDGTITEERIDESLQRIYRVKCAGKLE